MVINSTLNASVTLLPYHKIGTDFKRISDQKVVLHSYEMLPLFCSLPAHLFEDQAYLTPQSGTTRLDTFTHCLLVKCSIEVWLAKTFS